MPPCMGNVDQSSEETTGRRAVVVCCWRVPLVSPPTLTLDETMAAGDDVTTQWPNAPMEGNGGSEFTPRAVITGACVGAVLSLCNLYAGLKTSWTLNMSIVAALVGAALWQGLASAKLARPWGLLENNINQTAASAAASMPSAGLVAAVPALALLTGQTLSWIELVCWTASVSLFGVAAAALLRHQLLVVDALPFPFGVAIGETLKEMYASTRVAAERLRMFLVGALVGSASVLVIKLADLGMLSARAAWAIKHSDRTVSLKNLGFALDPSPLMLAVGALVGPRIGTSLLLGTILSWGLLAPVALDASWTTPGPNADVLWYGALNRWMVWPAVAVTVSASLTGFLWKLPRVVMHFRESRRQDTTIKEDNNWLIVLACGSGLAAVIAQVLFFDIPPVAAVVAVVMTFVLAMVAARVSGETGVSPVGPMGKVTQLAFGAAMPQQPVVSLMAANVTAGAANQCADLMDDLKAGSMMGAKPRLQALAQTIGVIAGAMVACAAYLLLIHNPQTDLLSEQWPAPAAASWKAVAEVCQSGLASLPPGAKEAAILGICLGVIIASTEALAPKHIAKFLPSATSIGLAMLIPAPYSISAFAGGLIASAANRSAKSWTARFLVVTAAGIIAGESLAGFSGAIGEVLGSAFGGP